MKTSRMEQFKKYISILCLSLAIALLFTGCVGIGKYVSEKQHRVDANIVNDISSAGADESGEAGDKSGEAGDELNPDSSEILGKEPGAVGSWNVTLNSGSDAAENSAVNSGSAEDDAINDFSSCTISIDCSSILTHQDDFNKAKEDFLPADGLILAPIEVEFEDGNTVYDILRKVCKDNAILMESKSTAGTEYVEGIGQIYEFDCGELSGWMYRVNGAFPEYGCASVTVSDGDVIEWLYTCEMGEDLE